MMPVRTLGRATAALGVAFVVETATTAPRWLEALTGGAASILLLAIVASIVTGDSDRTYLCGMFLLVGVSLALASLAVALCVQGRHFPFLLCLFGSVGEALFAAAVFFTRRRYIHAGVRAAEEYAAPDE